MSLVEEKQRMVKSLLNGEEVPFYKGENEVFTVKFVGDGLTAEIRINPGYEDAWNGVPIRRKGNSNVYTLSALEGLPHIFAVIRAYQNRN